MLHYFSQDDISTSWHKEMFFFYLKKMTFCIMKTWHWDLDRLLCLIIYLISIFILATCFKNRLKLMERELSSHIYKTVPIRFLLLLISLMSPSYSDGFPGYTAADTDMGISERPGLSSLQCPKKDWPTTLA